MPFKRTIFHRPEWIQFLSKIMRGHDESIPGLPVFRSESLPLADYCGPSRDINIPGGIQVFSLNKIRGSVKSPFCTFKLNIKGKTYDELLKDKVHQKHRNMVSRATREGIQIYEFDKDEKHLREYYRLYVETMLKLSRVPLPYRAFTVLAELFGSEAKIYLAQYQGQFIGGLFVFVYNGTMHIWGNASDRGFLGLGVNNALYAFAIKRACELCLNEIDFGSSETGSSHHFFKERWGGKEVPIYYRGTRKFGAGSSIGEKIVAGFMNFLPISWISFMSLILHKLK